MFLRKTVNKNMILLRRNKTLLLLIYCAVLLMIFYGQFIEQQMKDFSPIIMGWRSLDIWINRRVPKICSHRIKAMNVSVIKRRPVKRVLLYTDYFGLPWDDIPLNPLIENTECPIAHCEFTYNKSLLNSSDAIVFHGRDMESKNTRNYTQLRQSSYKQTWIWVLQESPVNSGNMTSYDNLFNVTATYKHTSSIQFRYYDVQRLCEYDERPALNTNYAGDKDRLVMGIVSNCLPFRINIIKELRKYIQFDLYGYCKYLVNFNSKLPRCFKHSELCNELHGKYKFYLAIENSFCEDYVTEKFYRNSLIKGAVPIVINGARLTDPTVAPPHSYINILDYPDLKSLAKYLKYLDSNDTAYNEYHRWRYYYKIVKPNLACNICKVLWEGDEIKNNRTENTVLSEMWSLKKTCKPWSEQIFQKYLKKEEVLLRGKKLIQL